MKYIKLRTTWKGGKIMVNARWVHSHTALTDKCKMLQAVVYNVASVSADLIHFGSSLGMWVVPNG